MDAVALVLVVVLAAAPSGPVLCAQQPSSAAMASEPTEVARTNASGMAAQNPLEKRISVMFTDEPISRALATIAARAGERFTYSSDDLPSAKHVSLAQRDASVGSVLQMVLAGTGLHAVAMKDGAVVLAVGAMHSTAPAPLPPSGTLALTGRVTDPDGSPLSGAMLRLLGTSDTATATDSGRFQIRGIIPGAYILQAHQLGFRPRSMPISVVARPTPVTVMLQPSVATLPVVTTTQTHPGYREVGFDQRMHAGTGEFLTYEQIAAQHVSRLTELLQRVRGVIFGELPLGYDGARGLVEGPPIGVRVGAEVDGMWVEGACVAVALDGAAQGVLDAREIDNLVDLADVGAIEVYSASERPGSTGPGTSSDQMPFVLIGGRDLVPPHCTLVVVWTRERLGIPATDTLSPSSLPLERGTPLADAPR